MSMEHTVTNTIGEVTDAAELAKRLWFDSIEVIRAHQGGEANDLTASYLQLGEQLHRIDQAIENLAHGIDVNRLREVAS